MSFGDLDREFFERIAIFGFVADFLLFGKCRASGFENDIFATKGDSLRKLLLEYGFYGILVSRVSPGLPVHLGKRFYLSIGTSGGGSSGRNDPGELKPPELAALELLLYLSLEILKLYLHAVVDVAVIHVFFGEETGLTAALLGFILYLAPSEVLILHCTFVGRGTDISKLCIFQLTFTDT